eukprot:1160717-Pelagomonas_calceolata.AAC.4
MRGSAESAVSGCILKGAAAWQGRIPTSCCGGLKLPVAVLARGAAHPMPFPIAPIDYKIEGKHSDTKHAHCRSSKASEQLWNIPSELPPPLHAKERSHLRRAAGARPGTRRGKQHLASSFPSWTCHIDAR